MTRPEDLLKAVQQTIGDTPLYLLAGAGDLVAEKLRELPETLGAQLGALQREQRDIPMRAAGSLIGAAFKANLKVGELYDDLTRRGQDVVAKMRGESVVAEEDEPFVREPFMPEPVRRPSAAASKAPAQKAAAQKAAAQKAAAQKAAAKQTAAKQAAAKKTAAQKTAAMKAAAEQINREPITPEPITPEPLNPEPIDQTTGTRPSPPNEAGGPE